VCLAPLSAVPLASCGGVLDPHGPVGAAEKIIFTDSIVIMLAIVVPTIVATLGFAWWFRASNTRAEYRPEWAFSGQLELIVWAIPTLVVIFLGGIAWFGSQALDPYRPLQSGTKAIEIEAVSLDWKWLFVYPAERIATVNQLVIPAGAPVHFRLTSSGVMNSFFVPQLGSQIYTMAGMASQLSLQADDAGTYRGLSAQFSGAGFPDMRFEVSAVAPDAFAQWIDATKAVGMSLDHAAYDALARPGTSANITYRDVEPGLFDAIVNGDTGRGGPVGRNSSASDHQAHRNPVPVPLGGP
jgi:cytochrome o ubiquinol oxidase subunit II